VVLAGFWVWKVADGHLLTVERGARRMRHSVLRNRACSDLNGDGSDRVAGVAISR